MQQSARGPHTYKGLEQTTGKDCSTCFDKCAHGSLLPSLWCWSVLYHICSL